MENKPKTTPKDFFLHLGAIAALYVSAASFIGLIFQLINRLFPDATSYYYASGNYYSSGIRLAIATLIITVPLYLYLTRTVNRDMAARPESAELSIRKWLTYLTLFAAGLAVAIDLVVVINSFLEGELTLRFILKVITVLAVAAGIFSYYRFDLKREKTVLQPQLKIAAWATIAVVVLSIISSFLVIGSPLAARNAKLDGRRISDLQNIQWQIVQFWQQKEKLPGTLNELADPISGYVVPKDPVTETIYEYKVTGTYSFELCAVFSSKALEGNGDLTVIADPYAKNGETWSHEKGRHCFNRSIDPERYPPYTRTKNPAVPL